MRKSSHRLFSSRRYRNICTVIVRGRLIKIKFCILKYENLNNCFKQIKRINLHKSCDDAIIIRLVGLPDMKAIHIVLSNTVQYVLTQEFFTPQYINEVGDFVVTCPGKPGNLNLNGGDIEKPLIFTNSLTWCTHGLKQEKYVRNMSVICPFLFGQLKNH